METQTKLAMQDAKFAVFMEELKQQREDIRRVREKHDSDIKDINARIDSKFDKLTEQIHDTWRQTMLGVGGMILAVGALLFAALK